MILWPYKKFIVESFLEAKPFSDEMLRHTEKNASGYYWFRRKGSSFSGEVSSGGFSVIKTVPYWNLSPLKIIGKYITDGKPLIIEIKMYNFFTLPVFVMVALAIGALLYNYSENPPMALIAGILIMFYLLINVPFQIEAAKAKRILLEISKGKIVK